MTSRNKKRVALFIDWFKPGYKAGGPITSCANMVDLLRDELHFFIFTRDRDYMENVPYSSVPIGKWTRYSENCDVIYIAPKDLTKKFFRSQLSEIGYDLIYVNGIFSKHFSMFPLKLFAHTRLVLAPRGMLRPSALAIKPLKKKIYLSLARRRKSYKNVVFQATTEEEAKDIERQRLGGEIRLAHNCPKVIEHEKKPIKKKGALSLCFVGRIAKEKNLLYALNILTGLDLKGIDLTIIGEIYDKEYWSECEEVIRSFNENIQVKMLGSLSPDDLQKELILTNVMFLPTRGENYGHTIYESLASGTPVIISDQTPWKGLKNKNAGMDIALKSRKGFLAAIKTFHEMDEKEYQRWTEGARAFAKSKVDLNKIKSEYIRLFK